MNFWRKRKKNYPKLIFTSLLLITAASSMAIESSGYLRSGFGYSDGGLKQECFKAPGAMAKHRLGNECENYLELGFTQAFNSKPGELSFIGRVLMALQSNGDRDWESTNVDATFDDAEKSVATSQDATLAFREAYVAASMNFTNEEVFWAGKRFYRRRDIHMLDYYLLINTGSGVGIENVDALGLTWHFALLRNIPKSTGPGQSNIDLRFSGLKVPVLGQLETTVIYAVTDERDAQTGSISWQKMNGLSLSFLFDRALNNGFNLFALQYGRGLFGGIGPWSATGFDHFGAWGSQNIAVDDPDTKRARDKSTTTRMAEQWVYKFSENLSHSLVLFYQDVDFGGFKNAGITRPNLQETTVGSRPMLHFSKNVALQFELGVTQVANAIVDNEGKYQDSQLQKITIAPTLTNDSQYFARPQLRLFATHASWNKESEGQIAPTAYSSKTSGWSAGAQIEVWW